MPERGLVPAAPSLSTITQSQIAAAGGTVKEVAARAIAELESRKALRREHGHIRYLDREVLLETHPGRFLEPIRAKPVYGWSACGMAIEPSAC